MSEKQVTVAGVTYEKCDKCSCGWDRQPTPKQSGQLLDHIASQDERIADLLQGNRAHIDVIRDGEADNTRLREALREYGAHEQNCVAGQWRCGEPTDDGNYVTTFGYGKAEVHCLRGEQPPCTCGLYEALSEGESDA